MRNAHTSRIAVALTFVALILAGTGTVTAGSKHAPLGYQLMCLQNPAECQGGGASQISATKAIMATLKRVNVAVNNAITPRRDGKADVWTVSASVGDCEDYAITKRHHLIKAGLPASALRIAYVKTRSGEGHAVLVVRTDKGDLVLDNLVGAIKPFSQSGLRMISMSGANPGKWS
jgi:predicted transglutaminase-like cysteine proteinase